MDAFLDRCRSIVRRIMAAVARWLNRVSGGRVSPNAITGIGLLAHLPIALLIALQYRWWAAGLLIIFGLFDTLDGELARLTGKAGPVGMLLDSTTDRMKEIFLYMGSTYAVVVWAMNQQADVAYFAAVGVAACGGALLTSYINAWGEVVISGAELKNHQRNKSFRGGLMRFEIRMAVLVIGLLTNTLHIALLFIAVMAWLTAFQRLSGVIRKLS